MLKKLLALSLLAVSVSVHGIEGDLFQRSYGAGKAKVTKAFKKENASALGKATLFGLLATAAAKLGVENAIALYKEEKNLYNPVFDAANGTLKDARLVMGKKLANIALALLVSSYATVKAGQATHLYLKKTQAA